MPKIVQLVSVDIKVKPIEYGRRKFEIAVWMPAKLFTLSDLLVRERALEEAQVVLGRALRHAAAEYIQRARDFVKEAARRKRAEEKVRKE